MFFKESCISTCTQATAHGILEQKHSYTGQIRSTGKPIRSRSCGIIGSRTAFSLAEARDNPHKPCIIVCELLRILAQCFMGCGCERRALWLHDLVPMLFYCTVVVEEFLGSSVLCTEDYITIGSWTYKQQESRPQGNFLK